MGRILQLKWYGWVLLSIQFLISSFFWISYLYWFIKDPPLSSPFIPSYAKYLSYIAEILYALPYASISIGIILMIFKKKLGWLFAMSFLLWYITFHLRILISNSPPDVFTLVYLILQAITVLAIFQRNIRAQLNIKIIDFVIVIIVPIIWTIIDLNQLNISMCLSRWLD